MTDPRTFEENVERSSAGAPLEIRPDSTIPPWAHSVAEPIPAMYAEQAYRQLVLTAEREQANRGGIAETPWRAAKAWRELTSGYDVDPASLFKTFDGEGYDEMVLLKDIPFYSLCEHHLLPFFGKAAVGYIPAGPIVGISKLARLVDCFARRLQNQERITNQIAEALVEHLDPAGVLVVVSARHLCMEMRGVRSWGQDMVTSAVRGAIKDKPEARAEALALLRNGGTP